MNIETTYKFAKEYGIPIIRTESHLLLEKFVKEANPAHVLEIGTAIGFSASIILNSCDGDILTIEHDKSLCQIAKQNLKKQNLSGRAKIIEGDCMVEIAKLVATKKYDNYFDFIFLDGPKAQYNLMLDSLVALLKPNGTLLVDNVLFRGYVEGKTDVPKRYKTIVKRLDTFIKNCKNHKNLCEFKLFYVEDGLIFAKKVQKNEKRN